MRRSSPQSPDLLLPPFSDSLVFNHDPDADLNIQSATNQGLRLLT